MQIILYQLPQRACCVLLYIQRGRTNLLYIDHVQQRGLNHMPSKESVAIKERLTADGFHHKWENAGTIRQYIETLPPYPALSEEQEGLETRCFQFRSALI